MTARSARAVPAPWLPFLGAKLGIAKALYAAAIDPDDFGVHQVIPIPTALERLLARRDPVAPHAGGAGTSLAQAASCAMGELLERYASFAFDGAGCERTSHDALLARGARPVALPLLQAFTPAQHRSADFPYVPLTSGTPVGWLAGTDLLDGRPTLVPAQFVALGYTRAKDEPPCFYPTSSGCALASTVEEALAKAVLEVLERDAFMIRWYARMPPPRLALDPADMLGPAFGPPKKALEVSLYDLTVDGNVPVVAATCRERSDRHCAFVLGAAAALDVAPAAHKALVEVAQGRPFIKAMAAATEAPDARSVFDDFDRNVRFYGDPAHVSHLEWFIASSAVSPRRAAVAPAHALTARATLDHLLAECRARALNPVAFDLTTRELTDAGLIVCKVVVPELVPLGVPSAPWLGHPRLAGFTTQAQDGAPQVPDWVPHPFP